MARTQKSYRVDKKNKKVILFTNIEQTAEDKFVINQYVESGWTLKAEKKVSVEDMKKALKKVNGALEEFERLYNLNEEDGALGFHRACQYYTNFTKANEYKKELKEKDKTALVEFEKLLEDLTYDGIKKAIKYFQKWKKENKDK